VNDDHRTLSILVDGPMDKNAIGLHTVDIQKAIRLKMLTYAPNLKVFNTESDDTMPNQFIWVIVEVLDIKNSSSTLGSVMFCEIYMQKNSFNYSVETDYIGNTFRDTKSYSTMMVVGSGKSSALEAIKEQFDDFLLDYLESNTSKPKKLKIEKLDPNKEYLFGTEAIEHLKNK